LLLNGLQTNAFEFLDAVSGSWFPASVLSVTNAPNSHGQTANLFPLISSYFQL
jgi:hypothetical protein